MMGGSAAGDDTGGLLRPFADSIWAMVRGLKLLEGRLSKEHVQRFKEAISDDIKKAGNLKTHRVSKAAEAEALRRGVELRQLTWHEQRRFDRGRQTFHVEHMVPVSALREKCIEAASVDEVHAILRGDLVVVWVLKEEDKRLTELGYKTKRKDPKAAYREADIELAFR